MAKKRVHVGTQVAPNAEVTNMCGLKTLKNDEVIHPALGNEGRDRVKEARRMNTLCEACRRIMDAYGAGYEAGTQDILNAIAEEAKARVSEDEEAAMANLGPRSKVSH